MKMRDFLIVPLLLSLLAFGCNKPTTYTIRLQNVSAGSIRVKVELLEEYAAPGQNVVKLDKSVLQGQFVEIYYNEGIGISMPFKDDSDSLLKYKVTVLNPDSIPVDRNLSNINNYIPTLNKKAKSNVYTAQVLPTDFD